MAGCFEGERGREEKGEGRREGEREGGGREWRGWGDGEVGRELQIIKCGMGVIITGWDTWRID